MIIKSNNKGYRLKQNKRNLKKIQKQKKLLKVVQNPDKDLKALLLLIKEPIFGNLKKTRNLTVLETESNKKLKIPVHFSLK